MKGVPQKTYKGKVSLPVVEKLLKGAKMKRAGYTWGQIAVEFGEIGFRRMVQRHKVLWKAALSDLAEGIEHTPSSFLDRHVTTEGRRNAKRLPPAKWPEEWMTALLAVISKLTGKYRYASHANFWRAYVLVARDTDWPLGPITSLRFNQIAPDGTVVHRPADHVPLIAKLSKETREAIEPLKATPRPDGRILKSGTTTDNLFGKWQRIIKQAGFDPRADTEWPWANAWPIRREIQPLPTPADDGKPQTIMQFLEHIYAPLRLSFKSQRTLDLYRISIRSFCKFLGRDAMLSDLTDDTITAYFAYLRKEELAAATIAKEYAQLTAIWRFACQRHKVGLYPTVAKPNVPRNEPQSWLREDLERLFKAIYSLDGWIGEVREPAWWLALHFVIWNTGERITALLSVKWSDIDLDGGWITIRAEYRKGKSRGKVHRLAPYTIEALRAIQLPERELVFEWHKSPKYLWQAYGEILKKAGLPNDRYSKFHRLRRTVATQYELLGGNATNLLGHSDRKTTVEHYLDRRVVVEPQAIDLLTRPDVATPANEPQQVSELEWL